MGRAINLGQMGMANPGQSESNAVRCGREHVDPGCGLGTRRWFATSVAGRAGRDFDADSAYPAASV